MSCPEVTIDQGTLRGSTATDLCGNVFFKFRGIPYAKPPLANLRFKAPQPPEKWTGIYDATEYGEVSYQIDLIKGPEAFGSENCLFINVYTKKLPEKREKLRPVLFWVHGGGFFFGSGNEDFYGPDFLITEDVVVVTFNYRLGLLGFIRFEDPSLEVYGNMGLKDQVMALKWVQKNISQFGGDPNNVTIFGESAGGASIHLLVLSPMTKGLFHKAIAQSGSAINPWVQGTGGSKILAEAMDLTGADDKTIYSTLMDKSVAEIFEIQNNLSKLFRLGERRAIGFVIERNSPESFLDEEPEAIMSTGRFNQVPLMFGYTTAEGMIFELAKTAEITDFKEFIPWNFGYDFDTPEKQEIAEEIKQFYNGRDNKYDLSSDCRFVFGIQTSAIKHFRISKTPIYLYRMSVETELGFLKKILKIETPGVSHMDDVGHLFKNFGTPEIASGSIADITVSRFVKLWTNFAKFGNPTPDPKDEVLKVVWKPVTSDVLDLLDIGEELVPMTNPEADRMRFWEKLFAESPAGKPRDVCCVRPKK